MSLTGWRRLLLTMALLLAATAATAFDHGHTAWNALLGKHVVLAPDGNAARVRYGGMQADRQLLRSYLDSLSAVSEAEYREWTKLQRLAFLINAYNAFTIELILGKYPGLKSIKDLGGVFRSPWQQKFFSLLGRERSLDELEHTLIRAPGVFDEPRIHVAVVCASIGCPLLRNEAFTAERLEAQLEDSMKSFLSDRQRNRFDPGTGTLWVSKIFDWYGKDFEQGHGGFTSLKGSFARYADRLADDARQQARIRAGDYRIAFLDYDWSLNDAP